MVRTNNIQGKDFIMGTVSTALEVKNSKPYEGSNAYSVARGQHLSDLGQFLVGRERWNHYRNATNALVEYAEQMLDEAERTIQMQQERLAYLEELVTRDELTRISNRRGFNEAFAAEMDRCNRGISKGGVVIMIDLDDFKPINDTHGHLAGDECLKLVAEKLQSEIRTMDVAARLGGDEFVILLSNTTMADVAERVKDILWQLNNITLAWYGEEIPVRASIGVQEFKAGDTEKDIIEGADGQLYKQKSHKGDNADAIAVRSIERAVSEYNAGEIVIA